MPSKWTVLWSYQKGPKWAEKGFKMLPQRKLQANSDQNLEPKIHLSPSESWFCKNDSSRHMLLLQWGHVSTTRTSQKVHAEQHVSVPRQKEREKETTPSSSLFQISMTHKRQVTLRRRGHMPPLSCFAFLFFFEGRGINLWVPSHTHVTPSRESENRTVLPCSTCSHLPQLVLLYTPILFAHTSVFFFFIKLPNLSPIP